MHMRRTLITGATSGLGRALVERLAKTDDVIGVGRNRQALDALLQMEGVVEAVDCDLARAGAASTLLANRPVDVLVNNAGVLPSRAAFADLPAEAIDAMIDVNFRAVMHLTQAALTSMRARGQGHIVFIGSSAGRFPHPGSTVYGATKSAVSLFSDALRAELVGERIRVTEIAPGRVRSNLYRDAIGTHAAGELYDDYEPLEPEDVADAVAFALDAPAHVDVSRLEIFPTSQAVGGGRIATISEMTQAVIKTGD